MDIALTILVPVLLLLVAGQAWWIRKWMKDMETRQGIIDQNDKELRTEFSKEKKEIFDKVDSKFAEVLTKFTAMGEKLEGAIAIMAENVNNMKTVVEVFRNQVNIKNVEFDRRMYDNNEWIQEHENELKDHSNRLTRIESYCKYRHNKED